jgi:KipI family sensor histidine kinase inhibitor
MPEPTVPTISHLGMSGLLLDGAEGAFSDAVQARVHAVAAALKGRPGVTEIVPGMNNLMVVVDPFTLHPETLREDLGTLWASVTPQEAAGKVVTVPVVYGGSDAEDLADWAAHCGLDVETAVRRHAGGRYRVAAVGSMPGFPYLSGLDPALARPRRNVPRARVPEGAVMVGGAQTGIMPAALPSGWSVIGVTPLKLFDLDAEPPALLAPGDEVRFEIVEIRR